MADGDGGGLTLGLSSLEPNFTVVAQTNSLWLSGYVEDISTGMIQEIQKMRRKKPHLPITVYVDSEGGDPKEALALTDYFELLKAHNTVVRTVVLGMSYSAATLISIAGTVGERYCLPHAEFLVHKLKASNIGGSVSDLSSATNSIKGLNRQIEAHFLRHCAYAGTDTKAIARAMGKESFFNYEEARAFGLVDKLLDWIH